MTPPTPSTWQSRFDKEMLLILFDDTGDIDYTEVIRLKSFIAAELEAQKARIVEEIKYRVPEEFKKHYKQLDADTLAADIVAKLIHAL